MSAAAKDDGWAPLPAVGNLAAKNHSSFDPRNYGFPKLSELVRKQSLLEVRNVASADGSPIVHVYVRIREARANA